MGSALVLVLMVVMTIGSMYLASRVFASKLVDQAESHGLVMELPISITSPNGGTSSGEQPDESGRHSGARSK